MFSKQFHIHAVVTILVALPAFAESSGLDTKNLAPIERSITDVQGRVLEGEILGKADNKIHFSRAGDGQEFTIGIQTLSQKDQHFLDTLPDGIFKQKEELKKNEANKKAPAKFPGFKDINDGNEVFLALPFEKQDRGGICASAALINCLKYKEPEIKISQEELFSLFNKGRSGASPSDVQAALGSFGYESEQVKVGQEPDELIIQKIQESLKAGLPVLSGSKSHVQLAIGFNKADETITVWDQKKGEDNPTPDINGKNPEGTDVKSYSSYLRKMKTLVLIKPKNSKGTPQDFVFKKTVGFELGQHSNSYQLSPFSDEDSLKSYLRHAMEARFLVEFRRNNRVFIHEHLGDSKYKFTEITAGPTNGVWPVKTYPGGEEFTISDPSLIKQVEEGRGYFSTLPNHQILGR
jgi:hypothetical protein